MSGFGRSAGGVVIAAACALMVTGCSLKDRSKFLGPPAPSEGSLVLNTTAPRFGDTLTATPSGSLDPAALSVVRYRIEWFVDGSSVQQTDLVDEGVASTLSTSLIKGQRWTVTATPVTSDEREGEPAMVEVEVLNTPPTVRSAWVSDYQPVAGDTLSAEAIGLQDVDVADTSSAIYRWTSAGTTSEGPTFTLPDGAESVSLQVVPSDGDDDGEALTLGPFEVLENITRWRKVAPDLVLQQGVDGVPGDFVAFDARNERFIIGTEGEVWEFTPAHGFVQLHPASDGPTATRNQVYYDGTVDRERLIVISGEAGGAAQLHTLSLDSRGKEEWTESPQNANLGAVVPDFRCFPNGFVVPAAGDSTVTRLFMQGGLADCTVGSVVDDVTQVLNMTDAGTTATWLPVQGNKYWGGANSNGVFGATTILSPDGTTALSTGGYNQDASTGLGNLNGTRISIATGNSGAFVALSGTLGPTVFVDEASESVVGSLGIRDFFQASNAIPVGVVWSADQDGQNFTGDPAEGGDLIPEPADQEDRVAALGLDGPGMGAFGVTGLIDGKRWIFPGYGVDETDGSMLATFQLMEVGDDPTDNDTWVQRYAIGREFIGPPAFERSARVDDGVLSFLWNAGTDLGALGFQTIDLVSLLGQQRTDMSAQVPRGIPIARGDAAGFVVTPSSDEPVLVNSDLTTESMGFDVAYAAGTVVASTICDNNTTMLTDTSTLITCTNTASACAQQSITPPPSAIKGPFVSLAQDGVVFGLTAVNGSPHEVWTIDLCDPAPSFTVLSTSGDALPDYVALLSEGLFRFARIGDSQDSEPRFVFASGPSFEGSLFITQTSPTTATVKSVASSVAATELVILAATAYDHERQRLLLLGSDTDPPRTSAFELRLRD